MTDSVLDVARPARKMSTGAIVWLVLRLLFYVWLIVAFVNAWTTNQVHGSDKQMVIHFVEGMIVFWVVVLEGLTFLIRWSRASNRKNAALRVATAQAQEERLRAEAELIAAEPMTPLTVQGLVLQSSEACYLRENAKMFGLVTTVQRAGGYTGASVRVPGTHGALRLNTGGFSSRPVSTTSMGYLGEATLILTNQRILLMSPAGNTTHALKDIVSVTPFTDGAQIDFSHGKPLIVTTGTQRLGLLIQRILHEKPVPTLNQ